MPKGYVSVAFSTSTRIKKYLENNFGENVCIQPTHIFHNYMILCLAHSSIQHFDRVQDYACKMKLYINKDDYERFGCYMNPRQTQLLNIHIDFYMKTILVAICDTYLKHHPTAKLKNSIDYALNEMNITSEEWDTDSIARYYHRSRKMRSKPLLYNKS